MDSEMKVWVAPADFGRDIQIAIVLEGSGVFKVATVAEGGFLAFGEPIRNGMVTVPTIRLSRSMAEQLLAGLLEQNVKSPSAGAIEGELKATKYHLEDMRKLLKVKP